jgi:hypothetical protein
VFIVKRPGDTKKSVKEKVSKDRVKERCLRFKGRAGGRVGGEG